MIYLFRKYFFSKILDNYYYLQNFFHYEREREREKGTLQKTKQDLLDELKSRVDNKIIEENNYILLKKLIEKAETLEEAIAIQQLGTMWKKTGFAYDVRLEKMTDDIYYFKKDEKLSFTQPEAKQTHKLIIGDNYKALINLQQEYQGKIKMIYIDPPYGKDSMGQFAQTNYKNNITRDNLLAMLEPRLRLARNLLSDDGVIFCSIDDKNQAYVKILFDEVFGEGNFIENFIWIKNATKNLSKTTSTNHEYILCYSKNKSIIEKLEIFRKKKEGLDEVKALIAKAEQQDLTKEEVEKQLKELYKQHKDWKGITQYVNVDVVEDVPLGRKHLKVYTLDNASAPMASGQGATYEIIHPKTGFPCKTPTTGWRFTRKTMEEMIARGEIEFYEDHTHVPRVKRFLESVEDEVIKSIIEDFTDGKKELARVFGECNFDNPKPTTLLKYYLQITDKQAIILDFFAGSGTTGQAVLEQNKADGGNRQFILVQLNEPEGSKPDDIEKYWKDNAIQKEFCEKNNLPLNLASITYERLKRVMTGEASDGSNFKWLEKNEKLGDNLLVCEVSHCANFDKNVFENIDETLYGLENFEKLIDKINWVCDNFEGTQIKMYKKKIEDGKEIEDYEIASEGGFTATEIEEAKKENGATKQSRARQ